MNGTNWVMNSCGWTGERGGRMTSMVRCWMAVCLVLCLGAAGLGARANGQAVVVQTPPSGCVDKSQSPAAVATLHPAAKMGMPPMQSAAPCTEDPTVGAMAAAAESTVDQDSVEPKRKATEKDAKGTSRGARTGDEPTPRANSQRRQRDVREAKGARGSAKTGVVRSKRGEAKGKDKAAKTKTMKIKSTKVKLLSPKRESSKTRAK